MGGFLTIAAASALPFAALAFIATISAVPIARKLPQMRAGSLIATTIVCDRWPARWPRTRVNYDEDSHVPKHQDAA
jgi:hypothetical protein